MGVNVMEDNKAEKGYIKMGKWKFVGALALAWFVGMLMAMVGDTTPTQVETGSNKQQETTIATQQTKETEPKEESKPGESEPKQKVVVTELSGSANKSSDTFRLSGGKVTLTYDFKGSDTIVGAIYILEEGTDLNTDGGIPEVMVTEPGSDTTIIRKGAGDYYLQVNSTTDFTVKIEEEK
jgi:hypothetical protein